MPAALPLALMSFSACLGYGLHFLRRKLRGESSDAFSRFMQTDLDLSGDAAHARIDVALAFRTPDSKYAGGRSIGPADDDAWR